MQKKAKTEANIMFAKRRADVHNLGFCAFYRSGDPQTFVRRARKVLLNPALRKHFSVAGKHRKKPLNELSN